MCARRAALASGGQSGHRATAAGEDGSKVVSLSYEAAMCARHAELAAGGQSGDSVTAAGEDGSKVVSQETALALRRRRWKGARSVRGIPGRLVQAAAAPEGADAASMRRRVAAEMEAVADRGHAEVEAAAVRRRQTAAAVRERKAKGIPPGRVGGPRGSGSRPRCQTPWSIRWHPFLNLVRDTLKEVVRERHPTGAKQLMIGPDAGRVLLPSCEHFCVLMFNDCSEMAGTVASRQTVMPKDVQAWKKLINQSTKRTSMDTEEDAICRPRTNEVAKRQKRQK